MGCLLWAGPAGLSDRTVHHRRLCNTAHSGAARFIKQPKSEPSTGEDGAVEKCGEQERQEAAAGVTQREVHGRLFCEWEAVMERVAQSAHTPVTRCLLHTVHSVGAVLLHALQACTSLATARESRCVPRPSDGYGVTV